jgi:transposase InsO family protein
MVRRHHLPADAAWVLIFGRHPFARQGYAQHDPERVDWHTRKVLAWRISNTLEAEFCVDALNEAIHKFGPPEIMNTDSHMMVTSSRVN